LTFSNGDRYDDRYEGDFVDNSFDGIGTLYKKDGSIVQQGQWKSGLFVGPK